MAPEFDCSREVVLPAGPQAVWEAVATSAGNAAWLFPNEIAPDGSGATAWDPPHHFAVRTEQGDWFNALDFVIEARDDGTSLLRYAHRGVFFENWDVQNDGLQQHTDFYLHTLGQYLEHFNGRTATYVGDAPGGIQGPPASARPDAFRRLQRALGLAEEARAGDIVRIDPEGVDALEGVIDYLQPNFMGIRTADALYRFFGRNAFGAPVGMTIHVFTAGADAEQIKRDWQAWLDAALA